MTELPTIPDHAPLRAAIEAVAAAGFAVYMRAVTDTYLFFTDGTKIGYLQVGLGGGYSLSTVHIPNKSTGTGFGVADPNVLDREALEKALIHTPHWVGRDAANTVRKYRDMEDMRSRDAWNAELKLVAGRLPEKAAPAALDPDTTACHPREIGFTYKNHRGEVGRRRVVPDAPEVFWGKTDYYPQPQ